MTRIIVLAIILLLNINLNVQAKTHVLVFAAASMKNALEVIGQEFERQCQCKMVFSFAGSGTLARQIEAGAPADVFISADLQWMNWLIEKNAVKADTQQVIATNRLIIAVTADKEISQLNDAANDAAELLNKGRIAMANPTSVPAGRYGRQALQSLGLWQGVLSRVVFGENVRVSLSLAARGDVATAIVYESDAHIEPRVKIAYLFASDAHEPIVYPASLVRAGFKGEEFLGFLASKPAKLIFQRFGFTVSADD